MEKVHKGNIDMTYSPERASILLNMVEKAGGHPQLKGLLDLAADELAQMSIEAADQFAKIRADRDAKAAEEAAKAKAEIDAQNAKDAAEAKAEAERQAKAQEEAATKATPAPEPTPTPPPPAIETTPAADRRF
jgi:hypothetical protein